MTLSMGASVALLVWLLLAGMFMWRLGPQLAGESGVATQASREPGAARSAQRSAPQPS